MKQLSLGHLDKFFIDLSGFKNLKGLRFDELFLKKRKVTPIQDEKVS